MTNLYDLGNLMYNDYLQMLKSHDNPLIWFEIEASRYKTNTSIILKVLKNYIETKLEKPEFVNIFQKLKEENNSYEYLFFNNITPSYLKEHLEEYLIYYRPEYKLRYDNKLFNTYKELIRKYSNYYQKQINIKENDNNKKIVLEFINSKYSLERFCIVKGLTLNDFNSKKNGIFIKTMKNDKELYTKFLFSLERKEKDMILNISNDIKNILNKIYTLGNDFSLIDLFLSTNYGIMELIKVADNILNIEDLKLFRKYMNICYRDYAIHGNFMKSERINLLITSSYTITIDNELIETTKEERERVINFLQKHEIPINSKIFTIALTRYYKENKRKKV